MHTCLKLCVCVGREGEGCYVRVCGDVNRMYSPLGVKVLSNIGTLSCRISHWHVSNRSVGVVCGVRVICGQGEI